MHDVRLFGSVPLRHVVDDDDYYHYEDDYHHDGSADEFEVHCDVNIGGGESYAREWEYEWVGGEVERWWWMGSLGGSWGDGVGIVGRSVGLR